MEQPQITAEIVQKTKTRWQSKTYKFAGLLIAFGIAALSLPEFNDLMSAIVPPQYIGFVPIVIGAIVAILREMTSEPIENSMFVKPEKQYTALPYREETPQGEE